MLDKSQKAMAKKSLISVLNVLYQHRLDGSPHRKGLGLLNLAEPMFNLSIRDWQRDPIASGLKSGVKEIGEHAAPHLTMDEMLKLAEAAAQRSKHYGLSIKVISIMWNGLKMADGQTWWD